MPNYPIEPDIARSELETSDYVPDPVISDDIQRTLAILMGWNEIGGESRFLRVDSQNRLYVTTQAVQTDDCDHTVSSLDTDWDTVLSVNEDRRRFIIQNTGNEDYYVFFGDGTPSTGFLVLASGEGFIDDLYLGVVQAKASASSGDLQVMEY